MQLSVIHKKKAYKTETLVFEIICMIEPNTDIKTTFRFHAIYTPALVLFPHNLYHCREILQAMHTETFHVCKITMLRKKCSGPHTITVLWDIWETKTAQTQQRWVQLPRMGKDGQICWGRINAAENCEWVFTQCRRIPSKLSQSMCGV